MGLGTPLAITCGLGTYRGPSSAWERGCWKCPLLSKSPSFPCHSLKEPLGWTWMGPSSMVKMWDTGTPWRLELETVQG